MIQERLIEDKDYILNRIIAIVMIIFVLYLIFNDPINDFLLEYFNIEVVLW